MNFLLFLQFSIKLEFSIVTVNYTPKITFCQYCDYGLFKVKYNYWTFGVFFVIFNVE